MDKIGFHVDRTITMKEDFFRPANMDVRLSWAEIEVLVRMYQVNVTIDGLLEDLRLPGIETHHGKAADPDRQKARQWMALCELVRCPTGDFEKRSADSPEIDVSIPPAPGWDGMWTIEKLWDHVRRELADYDLREWTSGLWQALSKG